jgi:fluoride exporter
MMLATVWVAIGGAIGSVARFWLTEASAKWWGTEFPWGTVIANVTGSFLIGLIAALPVLGPRDLLGPMGRQFLMVGIMGGYTTFSSFSLQTLTMVQHGHLAKAALNVGGSVVLCLLAVAAGYALGAMLSATKA